MAVATEEVRYLKTVLNDGKEQMIATRERDGRIKVTVPRPVIVTPGELMAFATEVMQKLSSLPEGHTERGPSKRGGH